jgi:uncharacterized peroxidase-related enzyme
MAFIDTIAPDEARGALRDMYARQQAKFGYVPNYAKIFSDRPEIMQLWADLLAGIRRNVDPRRFELVTFAAAQALESSYCSLAHGKALMRFFTPAEVEAVAAGREADVVTPVEAAMMHAARKVARAGASVTAADIDELKAHGLSAAEIFDVVATAAGRAFFANLCEGLGALADVAFCELAGPLREALTVGRPIDERRPERLDSPADAP